MSGVGRSGSIPSSRLILVVSAAVLISAGFGGVANARGAGWIGGHLRGVLDVGDVDAARAFGAVPRKTDDGEIRIPVIVEPIAGTRVAQIEPKSIAALGGVVDSTSRDYMRVLVDLDGAKRLATHPQIAGVRLPYAGRPDGLGDWSSEAEAAIGADTFHADGLTGAGVRLAVIDWGFAGLGDLVAAGELPPDTVSVDFTGTGIEGGTRHGSAVAELLMDIAPDARLFVVRIGDELDLQNAADFLRANFVRIANLSGGWVGTSYYDGTGPISHIVDESRAGGVLWVVSAGNWRERHWRGAYVDDDGDGFSDIGPEGRGFELLAPAGAVVDVHLNWNQYGAPVSNLDLYVWRQLPDGTRERAALGNATQNGLPGQRPVETVRVPVLGGARYFIQLRLQPAGGPAPDDVCLFVASDAPITLEPRTEGSSLTDPASASGSLAVGAVDHAAWNEPEPVARAYSSEGPTTDGRSKPDLVGPDALTSFALAPGAASGTSFSAPVVAGAAALYLSQNAMRSADRLAAVIIGSARDPHGDGIDARFGYGMVQLEADPNTAPEARADRATVAEDGEVAVWVLLNDRDADRDPIELVRGSEGRLGVLTVNANGTATYTPNADAVGRDLVRYQIRDAHGAYAEGVVEVDIEPRNDAPDPRDDAFDVPGEEPTLLFVTRNDVDVDGDRLTLVLTTPPPNGSTRLVGDAVEYTPDAGFRGLDSFTYRVRDPDGEIGEALVRVTVGEPAPDCGADNRPPVVDIAHPVVTYTLEGAPATAVARVVEACGITWEDDCTSNAAITHGVNDLSVDDPNEVISGGPGAFRSDGITVDWFDYGVNLDGGQVGPRIYTIRYAIIDGSDNWAFAECDVEVVSDGMGNDMPDVCDGIDNDGDGAVDEDFAPDAVRCGLGACGASGETACVGGEVVEICTPGAPSDELCGTGIDEDCDGEIDEGYDHGAACGAGIGACARPGVMVCTADRLGTECSAVPAEPRIELCGDGIDNDCDGMTDDGFDVGAICSVGRGECTRDGVIECAPDGVSTRCSARPGRPEPELCGTGADEDCDGETDEGFDTGAACAAGRGACARDGVTVCSADGTGVVCGAEPGPAIAETCNGIDDDCDGDTDEDFDLGAICREGEGACERPGRMVCAADGSGVECDAEPGPAGVELCNGVDDDCDGETDEGFGSGDACTVGLGACVRDGVRICDADGADASCRAQPGAPVEERCGNDIDDDCDGETDEGFDVGDACTVGVGACATEGLRACRADGRGTVCEAVAGDVARERCGNGVDDDCDGEIDEGFDIGGSCTVGEGACLREGTLACSADGTSAVCDAVPGEPGQEICDGETDEDCDGEIDEDFDTGRPCAAGIGACERRGSRVCSDDGAGTVCNATPGEPADELCNTDRDEDCDGETDEDECAADLSCDPDVAGPTISVERPRVEIEMVDGFRRNRFRLHEVCGIEWEDHCSEFGFLSGIVVVTSDDPAEVINGQPGFFQSRGAIVEWHDFILDLDRNRIGSRAYIFTFRVIDRMGNASEAQCEVAVVDPLGPPRERCNGIDDDDDGEIDEGYAIGEACTAGFGQCRADGATVCAADGLGVACDAATGAPGVELCGTGIDEDCDGDIDEGYDDGEVCTAGAGLCARQGIASCTEDRLATVCDAVPGEPGVELCGTGEDEDCDGLTDEQFAIGEICRAGEGVCARSGRTQCSADRLGLVCDAVPGEPGEELCASGLDEDCDGVADENECIDGDVCDPDRAGPEVIVGEPIVTFELASDYLRNKTRLAEACDITWTDACGDQRFLSGIVDITVDDPAGGEIGGVPGRFQGAGLIADWHDFVLDLDGRRVGPRDYTFVYRVLDAAGNSTDVECLVRVIDPTAGADELCDGNDNDDDGAIDEGYELGAPCGVGRGECRADGVTICRADGRGVVCDAIAGEPGPELCGTGADEDCDGEIDEGFDPGGICTVGVGACAREGVSACSGDRTSEICNAVAGDPTEELCGNGIDDDCNGLTDEGFGTGALCGIGLGECRTQGRRVCTADGRDAYCNAEPGEPGDELCGTRRDEDCDGEIDEGFAPGEICPGELDCTNDIVPPRIDTGEPTPTFALSDEPGWVRFSVADACQLTWTDACTAPPAAIHGINHIDSNDGEPIAGGPGTWRSAGIAADWRIISLNLFRGEVGPREYVIRYAVIDRSWNWGTVECTLRVVEPLARDN